MSKDGSGSEGSGTEPTQIDLGDDLIEKTAIIPGHPSSATPSNLENETGGMEPPPGSPATPPSIEDHLQSARILLNEGFPEEAKKVLRQILVSDPHEIQARKLLQEIHDSELKQIFSPAETVVRKSLLSSYDESILSVSSADSEEILRLLEKDMRPDHRGAAEELSFLQQLQDPKILEGVVANLERQIGGSPRDRLDLAIGFIEMGLYRVAIRLLQPLASADVETDRIHSVSLIGYAHLLADENYEAISALQPILNDNEIDKTAKTEIFYLLGRSYQALSFHSEAIAWFAQAQQNEPGYRDCVERISRSRSALSAGEPRR